MMKFKKIFTFLVWIIFSLFFLNESGAELVTKNDLAEVLPPANIFERKEEPFGHYFGFTSQGGNVVGVVFLTTEVVPQETWGYRDQIATLVGLDYQGKITGVKVLKENETPRYTKGLLKSDSWFLTQFIGKDVGDDFFLGEDVNAITGATISSSAITRGIEAGLEVVTEKVLYQEIEKDNTTKHLLFHHLLWQIDFVFLWIIVAIAFIAFFKKSRTLRYLVLGISIVYIGFLKGGGFSIHDVLNLGSLSFPVFFNNLYWYSLVIIAIGLTIIAGRFYCGWLCPFGAVLETGYQVVPIKYKVSPDTDIYLKLIKYIILLLLFLLYFLFKNKSLATYIAGVIEPFDTFFKLYGNIIFWLWLVSILFISSVISRFYCRYFCPLGAFFALLSGFCSFLKIRQLSVNLPEADCKGCKLAQKICQMEAITYDEKFKKTNIDPKECFMCNTCASACPVESRKQ